MNRSENVAHLVKAAPEMPLTSLPAAVLWDMDGTLVDTEGQWAESFRALVNAHGANVSEAELEALRGLATDVVVSRLVAIIGGTHAAAGDALEAQVAEMTIAQTPFMPGAVDAVRFFYERGVPQAIVTASNLRTTTPVAQAFDHEIASDARPVFAHIITDEAVSRSKPDPEPYRLAADRCGAQPNEVLAFEDSLPGATSAMTAGVPTVIVGDAVQALQLPDTPVAHLSSLIQLRALLPSG